ncbi:hypothetical protein ASG23_06690 [Cellulomonas sp. Leaf395]|nr:hypothetical protein ASG23_06690 [Cellulomonas sp. Leaf395]
MSLVLQSTDTKNAYGDVHCDVRGLRPCQGDVDGCQVGNRLRSTECPPLLCPQQALELVLTDSVHPIATVLRVSVRLPSVNVCVIKAEARS